MDQVDTSKHLDATPPAAVLEAEQSRFLTCENRSTENPHPSSDAIQRSSKTPENIRQRSVDDDDDVQILFSVPRRRKKRRKRLDSSSDLQEASRPEIYHSAFNRNNWQARTVSYTAANTGSQIPRSPFGMEPQTSFVRSMPWSSGIHSPSNFPHNVHGSIYGYGQQPVQHPAFASPNHWWDPVRPQTTPLPEHEWSSLGIEDILHRKRRHDHDWELPVPQRLRYRQSSQISPRTRPAFSNPIPNWASPSTGGDPYGRYNNNNMSAIESWPSFDWSQFNDTNTNQFISQALHQPNTPNLSSTSKEYSGDASQSQPQEDLEPGHLGSVSLWHQKLQVTPSMGPDLPAIDQSFSSSSQGPHENSRVAIPSGSLLPCRDQVTSQEPALSASTSDGGHAGIHVIDAHEATRGNAAVRMHNNDSVTRATLTPDIIRKPSLYKIPPWPSTAATVAEAACVPSTIVATHPIITPSQEATTEATGIDAGPSVSQPLPQSSASKAITTSAGDSSATQMNGPPNTKDSATSSRAEFQIPKARLGRKNSPNLIVDIAETCQELFPFAAVAERHKIPIKKVFDTYSAIIQLPLLRNADDRRRHGSLGKQRVKEYRDAKKAMERAQEAQRKAQMKAMRARVEEATKKGKEKQSRPLLQTAILNSASQSQNGGEVSKNPV